MPESEGMLRFVDVLTTSAAVTSFLGVAVTTASHIIAAVAILQGELTIEDLGRPVSPLLRSARGPQSVDPAVRHLVQSWFQRVGGTGDAEIGGEQLRLFVGELRLLESGESPT